MSSSLEAALRQLFEAHIQAGINPSANLDEFMQYIADDFTGIGTGIGDFMRSRQAFHDTTLIEREKMEYKVAFSLSRFFARPLHPKLVLVEGDFQLEIEVEEHLQKINVRFSLLFKAQNGTWLITHSHYSNPDPMLGEGDTLNDALMARNEELEKEVAARTAALEKSLEDLKAAQAQLIHQEKMASLGALTAGIAHEIKNPLNFITNFANLSVELADELEQDLANGEEVSDLIANLKRNAASIDSHGRRADAIIKGMMQHASNKTGEKVSLNLNPLLDEYINLALHGKKAQKPGFHCDIERDFEEQLPAILAVPGELGRVFINLLSNAFDALAGQKEATIRVTTRLIGQSVKIQFSDSGPGLDPAIANRIFEPFFTTKPAGAGTGLGLSLSYDIITQGHGGTFEIGDSELGGATFVITLPVSKV